MLMSSADMKMRLQIEVLHGIILVAAFVPSYSSEGYVDTNLSEAPNYKGVYTIPLIFCLFLIYIVVQCMLVIII